MRLHIDPKLSARFGMTNHKISNGRVVSVSHREADIVLVAFQFCRYEELPAPLDRPLSLPPPRARQSQKIQKWSPPPLAGYFFIRLRC